MWIRGGSDAAEIVLWWLKVLVSLGCRVGVRWSGGGLKMELCMASSMDCNVQPRSTVTNDKDVLALEYY
jgi:hypothetical protein